MTPESQGAAPDRRLQSWKEIAAFFGRDERTVKRWEQARGLPVRRVPGGGKARVYAYVSELDQWLKAAGGGEDAGPPAGPGPLPTEPVKVPGAGRYWRRLLMPAAGAVLVGAIALTAWFAPWRPTHPVPARTAIARAHRQTAAPDAKTLELYRAGVFFWQQRTPASLNLAVDRFTQVIVRDPSYAKAYAGLADCYNLLREFSVMPPDQAYARAEEAARRAIALDPRLAGAHASLAFVEFYWRRNVTVARGEFERALALDPKSVVAHHWYATFLMTIGHFDHALREIDTARSLDRESTAILADRGLILFYAGRRQEAVDSLRGIERARPGFLSAHTYLADIELAEGRDADYLREIAICAKLRDDPHLRRIAGAGENGWRRGGRRGMFRALLATGRRLYDDGEETAYALAELSAASGDRTGALSWLKASVAHREPDNVSIGISPYFAPLRANPEYRQLVRAAGLPIGA